MFTIDLLKGSGRPTTNTVAGLFIIAITWITPLVIVIAFSTIFLKNKIDINVQKAETIRFNTKISELSDSIKLHNTFEASKKIMTSTLSEVYPKLDNHMQWSDVLTVLAESLPGSIILTHIDVKQSVQQREIQKANDLQKTTNVNVMVRTLTMEVIGKSTVNCDKAVEDFHDKLRYSDVFTSTISVSQGVKTVSQKEVVFYTITCVFDPKS